MIFLTWLSTVAGAATLNVPGAYSDITSAMNVAVAGDEIVLAPGGLFSTAVYQGATVNVPNITIKSAPYFPGLGSRPKVVPPTVFTGGPFPIMIVSETVFNVTANGTLTLEGVELNSGGSNSRCLRVDSPPLNPGENSVTIDDVNFVECTYEDDGGALFVGENAVVSISDASIEGTTTGTSNTRGGAIRVDGALDMTGGTIFGGNATYGGGIYVYGTGTLALDDVEVTGNWSDYGGGIYASTSGGNASISLNNVVTLGNYAQMGGFFRGVDADMTVANSTIANNFALTSGALSDVGRGGAFYQTGGTLNISDSTCTNNTGLFGGCLYARGGADITVTDVTMSDNSVENEGGSIYLSSDATLTATEMNVDLSVAEGEGGGGLYMGTDAGLVELVGGSFVQNSALGTSGNGLGGGIYMSGTNQPFSPPLTGLSLVDVTFFANIAQSGGGLASTAGRTYVSGGSFVGDSAIDGGCIMFEGLSITITDNIMQACDASVDGGALHSMGTAAVTVLDSEVKFTTAGARGGAMWTEGPLTVNRTLFRDTESVQRGGAVYARGSTLLENVIFEGASTTGGFYGGAVAVSGSGNHESRNVTFFENSGLNTAYYSDASGSHLFDGVVLAYNTSGSGTEYAIQLAAGPSWTSNGLVVSGQPAQFAGMNPSDVVVDYQYPFADINEDTIGTPDPHAYSGLWLRPNSPAQNVASGTNPDGSDADAGAFGGASADEWGGPWLWDGDSDGAVFAVDCDDADALYFPGATENPGGAVALDFDCDGFYTCYADADGDGFGDDTTTVAVAVGTPGACDSAGASSIGGDCNDNNEDINPESEVYVDSDNDGYGGENAAGVDACSLSDLTGYSVIGGDCDDSSASVNPGAFAEVVGDEIDQNCDGYEICHVDSDNDGYGGFASGTATIPWPSAGCASFGHSTNPQDCNDSVGSINPAAAEIPGDGVDSNCDNQEICYVDQDGDGLGSTQTTTTDLTCSGPNLASVAGDCDDNDATSSSGTTEIPADGIDQDCDGTDLCFVDGDFDGFGDNNQGYAYAALPGGCSVAGFATIQGDCDDANSAAYPGATEVVGNEVDENCDALVACWEDGDGDGYATWLAATVTVPEGSTCASAGHATLQGDCEDDANNGGVDIYPSAVEDLCDGIDSNCNCSGYPGEPAGTVDGIDDGGNSCGGPDQDFDMDGLTWLEEPDVLDADCDDDLDDDGLLDGEEGVADPINPDSDGDGILDGEEVEFFGGFDDEDGDGFENVIDDDDDDDGLLTSFERTAFVAPICGDEPWRDPDIDGDGVEDGLEGLFDVDMDGVPAACDADESFGCGFDPAVRREELRAARASAVLGGAAYPTAGDADGDGLLDQDELGLYCADGSMPDVASCDDALHGRCEDGAEALAFDSDADGRADWLDDDDDDDGVLTADESTTADPDGDGLPDYLDPDSDGDGIPDGQDDGSDDTDGPDDNDGPGDGGDGGGDGDDDDKDSGGCGHLPGTQAGWLILLGAAALRRRRSA